MSVTDWGRTAIYLLAVHHWDPASIGVVMTLAGIAALLTQTPWPAR